MNYTGQLLLEATTVGIVTTILGLAVIGLFLFIQSVSTKKPAPSPVTFAVIAAGLFVTGFLAHLLFEAFGLNKFYLTNSAAARKALKETKTL